MITMLTQGIQPPHEQQGYITAIIYIVAGIALISTIGFTVNAYNSAIKDAEKYKKENSQLTQLTADLQTDLYQQQERAKALDKLLSKRRGQQEAAAEYDRKLTGVLNELRKNPEVKKWADTSIPLSITSSLREFDSSSKEGDSKTVPARKPTITQ